MGGKRWALISGAAGYYFFVRPQMLKWGTRLGESQRLLPGDALVPRPNFQMTHAANIDAPPEAVWPWLAQMGREGTGYYGLDALTNRGIPSVTFLRRDIAAPTVGMSMDGGYQLLAVEPERQLLFGANSLLQWPGAMQDVSVLYLLERRRDGSTRLISRRRSFTYGGLGLIHSLITEPVSFAFLLQQFSTLKRLAEGMAHLAPR